MIPEPTIVDDSVAVAPLSTLSVSGFENGLGSWPTDITAPLFTASVSSSGASVVVTTVMPISLMSCSASILSPGVVSAFGSSPSTDTGVAISRKRAPNPYSPKEVRKSIQLATAKSADQSAEIATINQKLSEVQSDLSDLEDELDAIVASSDSVYSAEADESITTGKIVYIKATGHAGLAKADSASTFKAAGVASTSVTTGFSVSYNADGKITIADWTAIAGSASLTPGAIYYLSEATAGAITSTAPETGGQYVVPIGRAYSTTTLDIELGNTIRL